MDNAVILICCQLQKVSFHLSLKKKKKEKAK